MDINELLNLKNKGGKVSAFVGERATVLRRHSPKPFLLKRCNKDKSFVHSHCFKA